ncbi:MAG: hypothetical protein IJ190_05460 [Prevotella sp.]|nr:hypothetical protein [Prevotella sp.]
MMDLLNILMGRKSPAERLYGQLNTKEYQKRPFETNELGEEMSVVNEVIDQYWKPRYLLDHRERKAYEFMNPQERLVTVTPNDIDWDSLADLSDSDKRFARELNFHFPSFVRKFENGVAEVDWQLNPDGRYYMDEDGFGMTDDEEVNIYGFIDRTGRVLVKFRTIQDYNELDEMRKEAEGKALLATQD